MLTDNGNLVVRKGSVLLRRLRRYNPASAAFKKFLNYQGHVSCQSFSTNARSQLPPTFIFVMGVFAG